VLIQYLTQGRCTDIGKIANTPSCPSASLFPTGAFSHRVVWFFQVVRGSAAKFIQSAKLCSTPCRLPEGSSPTNKRWEPELNAGAPDITVSHPPPHRRPFSPTCTSASARSFDRARSRAHTYTSRALSGLSDAIRVGLGLQPPWGCPFAK